MFHQFALRILYIFVIFGMVHASANVKDCNKPCPRIILPVCDGNGKVYSNQCELEIAMCLDPGLRLPSLSHPYYPCDEGCCLPNENANCNKPCTREYNPVCDGNGKEYRNQCLLEIEICKKPGLPLPSLSHPYYPCNEGCCLPNESANVKDCRKGCPRILIPVCDGNGKVYGNQCLLEIAMCLDPDLSLPSLSHPYYPCREGCCLPKEPRTLL